MVEFGDIIILKHKIAHILVNEMKYEAEICYVMVPNDADVAYGIEIRLNCPNRSNLVTS